MSIEVNNLMNLADGQVLYNDLRNRQEDIVKVSDTQPTSPDNKIWIDTDSDSEVEVPTYDDISALQIIKNAAGALGAAGSAASFSDGANGVPVKNCIVDFYPYQDLHGQDNPWPGGANKNKYSGPSLVTVDNQLFANIEVDPIPVGTYTISATIGTAPVSGVSCRISFRNSSGAAIEAVSLPYTENTRTNVSFALSETCTRIYFYYAATTSGTGSQTFTDVQIEKGSSATSYSPYENICSITGWTGFNVVNSGINVWNEEWEVGGIVTETGADTSAQDTIRSKGFISVKPCMDYKFVSVANCTKYVWFFDESKNIIPYMVDGSTVIQYQMQFDSASNSIITPENCHYIRFMVASSYGTTYNHDISVNINYRATGGEYHTYSGETVYPVGWETEAGTVYGGQINVATGELKALWASVDLGTLTWEYIQNGDFVSDLPDRLVDVANTYYYSSIYGYFGDYANASAFTNDRGVGDYGIATETEGTHIYVRNTSYSNASDFKTAMSGVQLVYQLATPVVYHIPPVEIPTMLGQNDIYTDCVFDSIHVDYCTDTKTYVDANAGVKDVQVNGASIVQDGVANVPIASNNNLGVVMVGNGLAMSTNGTIGVIPAPSIYIKAGEQQYNPIAPKRQHESTFYGLAKAAGDTTQAQSSNAVGTYTDNAKAAIKTMLGVTDPAVQDVQVNGTSILSNGVAEIPIAGYDTPGLMLTHNLSGLLLNANNNWILNFANSSDIKNGASTYKVISVISQHRAAFFGLAKAAGDTTQAQQSGTEPGVYTENAKSKISDMLNAPVSVSGATPTINAMSGVRYICGEVSTLTITPPASGDIEVIFDSGSTATVLTVPSTVKFPEWFDVSDLEANKTYDIIITNGVYGVVTSWA